MFKLLRFGGWMGAAALVATAVLGAIAPAVKAAPPPDVFRDAAGNVYVYGPTATSLANQSSPRIGLNEGLIRSVRAGYCGEIRLSTSSSLPSIGDSWTINGTTRLRSNLPSVTVSDSLPRCAGNTYNANLTAAMTSAGGYIDATNPANPRVFLVGYSAGISYDVSFNDVSASQSARVNACGFFRVANTTANPLPSQLTIDGTDYTVASLPVADPLLCQRNSATGNYIRYTPATW